MNKLEHVLGILFGCGLSLLVMYALGGSNNLHEHTLWFYLKCSLLGFIINALVHSWVDMITYVIGPYSCCKECYTWSNHPWYNNWENNGYNFKFVVIFHAAFIMVLYSDEIYKSLI